MISKYKYIIWDWNGTLLNDVWLCIEIMNEMLEKRNLPGLTYDEYREIFDFPVQGYYEKAGFTFKNESFEDVSVEYCDEYVTRVNECDLHKDALSVLDVINGNGVVQTILSATDQQSLNKMVSDFTLDAYFHKIIGQDNQLAVGKTEKGKQLIEAINIDSDEIVLIGDTTHDVEVANALGVDCILLLNGHHSRPKLEMTGVEVVQGLSDLIPNGNQI